MKSIVIYLIIAMTIFAGCRDNARKVIRDSVKDKLDTYPASTLRDLYKSYFQDYYGPGHLISDTTRARKYLEYELGLEDYKDTVMLDPAGYEGNFYRVNLLLLKEGTIPTDVFMKYFLESAGSVQPLPVPDWKKRWEVIQSEIDAVSPDLPGYAADREFIDSLLRQGEFVVHHSDLFIQTYHPHYRIIHREIFDEHLSGYLEQ
mgnify:CR=1 FL=1